MSMPFDIFRLLDDHRVPFTVVRHAPVHGAQHEAAAAHVSGRHVAKTVLCFADGEPIQAVLPAPCSVDVEALRDLADADALRLAHADELPALYPGCDEGTTPPLNPALRHRVFLDESLVHDPELVINAGTCTDGIRLDGGDFAEMSRAVVGRIARRPGRARVTTPTRGRRAVVQ